MSNEIIPTIEDISKNMDYRLVYDFGFCTTCEMLGEYPIHKNMGTYIHRTEKEVKSGITHNINQYHGQLGSKDCHITKPGKHCNFCGTRYSYDLYDCDKCKKRVKLITQRTLLSEYYEKRISQINRNKGGLTTEEKENQIKKWNDIVFNNNCVVTELKKKR